MITVGGNYDPESTASKLKSKGYTRDQVAEMGAKLPVNDDQLDMLLSHWEVEEPIERAAPSPAPVAGPIEEPEPIEEPAPSPSSPPSAPRKADVPTPPPSAEDAFLEVESSWIQAQYEAKNQAQLADDKQRQYAQAMNASSGSIWGAAFATENTAGSIAAQIGEQEFPPLEGYNPYDSNEEGATDIDGYEQFYKAFGASRSPEQTAVIKSRIDEEMRNRQILAEGGAEGLLASIAAGVTDPINLVGLVIPLAAGAKTLDYAYAGFAASAATEVGLQGLQHTRTAAESAANIVAGTLLSGVLGAAVNGLSKAARDRMTNEVAAQLMSGHKSAGAASAAATGSTIKTDNPLSRLAATMTKITPLGRTLQSKNETVRRTVQELSESGIRLNGDTMAVPVESMVKRDYAQMSVTTIKVRDMMGKWMKSTGMDELSWNAELIGAMRRGDRSNHPEIEAAAAAIRKDMDQIWEAAAAAKVDGTYTMVDGEPVPIRASTSESYMTRRYDLNAVRNDPEGYKRAWMDAIDEQRVREGKSTLDRTEAYEVASDIYDNVINLKSGDSHFNIGPSGAAQTKQRVDVKDSFFEDFLVKDWESLLEGYMKSLAPRTRIAERFGDYRMTDQLDAITNQYSNAISRIDRQIDNAPDAKSRNKLVREKKKVSDKMQSEIRDLEIMRDRILNVPQEASTLNPENRGILSALRAARSWNIVTSLSNMLISSVPDMARLITYNGAGKFSKAFARSAFTKSIRRRNLPTDELAKMASAMERASAYRLGALTEVEDGVVFTRGDKYAHKAADAVLTASGSKHWNSVTKTIAGYLYGDKLGRALIRGNADDISKLNRAGLSGDALSRARASARQHGFDDDGLFNLNLERWADRDLVQTIEAGAVREADLLVITPSAGDKPIFFTTEAGRTIFQFKSFMLASTNRLTLPITQEGGARPWAEIMTHVGLGLGVYALRSAMNGKEMSEDPAVMTVEAVASTGLAGYGLEMAKMAGTLSGYNPLEEEGDYRSHAGLAGMLGPTASMVERSVAIPSIDQSGDAKAKAVRKLLPMQNHFILRNGYDKLEENLAKTLGGGSSDVQF